MTAILDVWSGRTADIGFPVRRSLPVAAHRSIGPFVFLDHMGPARFASGTTEGDVRPHPHIGLATVTYLFSGAMMHRDSLGMVQRIEPGAVNWMISGSGIAHSERIPADIRDGNVQVEGIQMWVALPKDQEEREPSFRHYEAEAMPRIELDGVSVHLLCGEFAGQTSPVVTNSPTFYMAVTMRAQGQLNLPPTYPERAIYVACGQVLVNSEPVAEGETALLAPGETMTITATEESRLMVLGGEPLDGPRQIWWNFVSSDPLRIEAARARWKDGGFTQVPGETEFIPLPER